MNTLRICGACHIDPCVCALSRPTTLEQAHSVAHVVGILGDEIARLRAQLVTRGDEIARLKTELAHARKRCTFLSDAMLEMYSLATAMEGNHTGDARAVTVRMDALIARICDEEGHT